MVVCAFFLLKEKKPEARVCGKKLEDLFISSYSKGQVEPKKTCYNGTFFLLYELFDINNLFLVEVHISILIRR